MKKKRIFDITSYVILLIAIILFFIALVCKSANLLFIINLLIITNMIFYSLNRLRKRIVILLFTISYFTFLLGKLIFIFFENNVLINLYYNSLILTFISLIFIFLGNVIFENSKIKLKKRKKKLLSKEDEIYVQRFSEIGFYLTTPFYYLIEIEKIMTVKDFGYIGLYTEYQSSLPLFIQKLAVMNTTLFLIYIATYPSAKKTYKAFIFYVIGLILSLLSGVRGNLVTSLMFLFAYVIIRNMNSNSEKIFSSKRIKIMLYSGSILLICYMGVYSQIRLGDRSMNLVEGFSNFFSEQGSSIEVLKYSIDNSEKLKSQYPCYSGFAVFNYNKLTEELEKTLLNIQMPKERYLGNLGYTITYYKDNIFYELGGAFGSQYIAELFLDFSYLGIVIFSFCVGILITKIPIMKNNGIIRKVAYFYILKNILFLPRDTTFGFLTSLFSFTNLILIIFLIFSCKYFKNKYIAINISDERKKSIY